MNDWCILRTSGASTLRLFQSLSLAGYDAWTPVELQVKRDRRKGTRTERMVAVMPTYVFAQANRLTDLLDLSNATLKEHPDFSLFRPWGRIPLVDDSELSELRRIERKAAALAEPVRFTSGIHVRAPDTPYAGLTGQVIEASKGQYTLVAFPGFHIPVKFASWKLQEAA